MRLEKLKNLIYNIVTHFNLGCVIWKKENQALMWKKNQVCAWGWGLGLCIKLNKICRNRQKNVI